MKHLGLSGGATKIAGLTGAAFELIENFNFKPDIISGVSSGSILTLPIALGKWNELEQAVKNLKMSDFFDIAPVNKKGKFRLIALWRIIIGKTSLGSQLNLVKTLEELISEEDFIEYQHGDYPKIYIGTVDFKTGGRHYFNIKDTLYSYKDYLKIVLASTSAPIFTAEVKMQDMILFDGGVRDHIATPWVIGCENVTETVSIYSRPENYVTDLKWKAENVLNVLERYVEITNIEISKSDEALEDLICEKKNIKQTKIFLPRILKSTYDVNKERLAVLYNAGREATANAILKV